MKKSTYLLEDDEEILQSVEVYNKAGLVIRRKDIDRYVTGVTLNEYNSANLLIRARRYENDVLLNVVENSYNSLGKITEQKLFIGEEVYEVSTTLYNSNGFTRVTVQDGEEIERLVSIGDEVNFRNEYYEAGSKVQYHVSRFDSRERCIHYSTYDSEDTLLSIHRETLDRKGRLILEQEYNANEELLIEKKSEYEDGQLRKSQFRNFLGQEEDFIMTYFYDEAGNLIKRAQRTLTGKLRSFLTYGFDENNRCIEEVRVSQESSDLFYGNSGAGERIHLIHRYESTS